MQLYNLSQFLEQFREKVGVGQNIFDILDEFLDDLLFFSQASTGNVSLTDPFENVLTIISARGLDKEKKLAAKFPFGIGITGTCAALKKTLYVPDVRKDKRYIALTENVITELCVPLVYGEEVIGVVNVESKEIDKFSKPLIQDIEKIALELTFALVQNKHYRDYLSKIKENDDILNRIVGYDPKILFIKSRIRTVAVSDASVLIYGESGSGKEMIAQGLHQYSNRKEKPFISLNCGALNENLLESELFGHVKGAFTGADRNHIGKFEAANGGTIFLDEVFEMTPALQVKLLRVLQERELEKVGDNKKIKIDVRVVSATHRDLSVEVEKGTFRLDLFFRLGVIPIHLPPLRERKGDIPLLAHHFLNDFNQRYGKKKELSPEVLDVLNKHHWPGNVRELQNVIHYMAVISSLDMIFIDSVPEKLIQDLSSEKKQEILQTATAPNDLVDVSKLPKSQPTSSEDLNLESAVVRLESEYILKALEIGKTQDEAARILGISRGALQYKLRTNPFLKKR